MSGRASCLTVVLMATCALVTAIPTDNSTETGHQSGMLYITPKGRLKMPVGTVALLTPTLSIPMGGSDPSSASGTMAVSVPFRFDFDELGLTDLKNNWGYVNRVARDASPQEEHKGGDRSQVYRVAENTISSSGLDGRVCLLRAICEINLDYSIEELGLLGEVLHLMLSPSKSTRHMGEYTEAETQGKAEKDCSRYHTGCPYSFFYDQKV
ncbi:uncharacterized protein LOC123510415 [Portunus trituberculatus]|uniref:uncharacterized protein LOC123510415 n=1 Tax=Portunus trituberculatus TaxID=210409 RepID=UPI001E1CDAE2|nr:uncharacterized protein LOC123510415 [Portunus trituberculatus]